MLYSQYCIPNCGYLSMKVGRHEIKKTRNFINLYSFSICSKRILGRGFRITLPAFYGRWNNFCSNNHFNNFSNRYVKLFYKKKIKLIIDSVYACFNKQAFY